MSLACPAELAPQRPGPLQVTPGYYPEHRQPGTEHNKPQPPRPDEHGLAVPGGTNSLDTNGTLGIAKGHCSKTSELVAQS